MPITTRIPWRRWSQEEFGAVAYEVMRHVFDIHNELGRFFDERIYKQALANRLPHVRLEEPIDLTFDSFHKRLFADVLVGDGGLFEFKAVEKIASPHRAQLLNYLFLGNLAHGKLINVRPESVAHEFVNTTLEHAVRTRFAVDDERWDCALPGAVPLRDFLIAVMKDWGAGMAIGLYLEVITHFFGGPGQVETDVRVSMAGCPVGSQRMHLIAPGVALKITALSEHLDRFETHARRLLAHLDLRAIAWINISVSKITFATLNI